MADTPGLRSFPGDDAEFARVVEEVAATLDLGAVDADRRLQEKLRERYVLAVVRPQHDLAQVGSRSTWYVYRYGTIPAPQERWYERAGIAAITIDGHGIQIAMNEAAERLIGYPRAAVVGTPVAAVLAPHAETAPEDAARMWEAFVSGGEPLHGSFRVPRPDGSTVELDYHVIRDGAGRGRHLAAFRLARPDVRLLFANKREANRFLSEVRRLAVVAEAQVRGWGESAVLDVPAVVYDWPLIRELAVGYGATELYELPDVQVETDGGEA